MQMLSSGQETNSSNRPYPPASNITALLHRLRSRNLPDRVDADYLRDAGISESLVHRVASALRFLGLVENDMPTQALRTIVTSTDEEYRDNLASLIRSVYAEVFAVVDPAQDSQERIVNFFRRYTPASQRERMVNFFLAMCREAGIPTLDLPRQRPMADGPRPKRPQTGRGSGKPKPSDPSTRRNDEGLTGIPPALEVLIRSLPAQGETMSAETRRRWLNLAEAALAFAYPEPTESFNGSDVSDDEEGE